MTADPDQDDVAKGYYDSASPVYGYNSDWSKFYFLASDWQDLLDGSIAMPLVDALSLYLEGTDGNYFSGGTLGAGSGGDGVETCSGWTSRSGYAGTGNAKSSNKDWLSTSNTALELSCNSAGSFLCAAKYNGP